MFVLFVLHFDESDEVGFVHPSQFVTLRSGEEGGGSSSEMSDASVDACFWSEDHKLGISTDVVLPLYQAAKCAFMAATTEYKPLCNASDDSSISSCNDIESEVMKRSRALLLLSYDFGTAWHSRFALLFFFFSLWRRAYDYVVVLW